MSRYAMLWPVCGDYSVQSSALHPMMASSDTNDCEALGLQEPNHLSTGKTRELRHAPDLPDPRPNGAENWENSHGP